MTRERISLSTRTPRAATPDARTSEHLRPLDSVIAALEESPCAWCQGLLRLILQHLEEDIPVYRLEVLN